MSRLNKKMKFKLVPNPEAPAPHSGYWASMVAMSMEKPCAMASRSVADAASRSRDCVAVTNEKQRLSLTFAADFPLKKPAVFFPMSMKRIS